MFLFELKWEKKLVKLEWPLSFSLFCKKKNNCTWIVMCKSLHVFSHRKSISPHQRASPVATCVQWWLLLTLTKKVGMSHLPFGQLQRLLSGENHRGPPTEGQADPETNLSPNLLVSSETFIFCRIRIIKCLRPQIVHYFVIGKSFNPLQYYDYYHHLIL